MLAKGDLVTHPAMPAWGIGKVMKIVQDGNLLVKFEGAGRKLLHPHYANLLLLTRRNGGAVCPAARYSP